MADLLNSIFLMAPAGGQGGGNSMITTFIMFGAVILIMYFMMIRPQQKRQKEMQNMLSNLREGDKVVLNSGMHGTITKVEEKTFIIQIADNTKVKFEKSAVVQKV